MKIRDFRELTAPIRDDPERLANRQRHLIEAEAEILDYNLAELRRWRACTQHQLAEMLDVAQPAVSRIEHTVDAHLSTLRAYVEALGGTLEVAAVFGDERVPLALERRREPQSEANGDPSSIAGWGNREWIGNAPIDRGRSTRRHSQTRP